jgi:hypothetical protein
MQNSITQIIAHTFILTLAFGTQLLTPVVSTRLTGVGFFKLSTSIVLASLVIAFGLGYFMLPPMDTWAGCGFLVLILTHGLAYVFHKDQKHWSMWLLYGIQLLVFCSLVFYLYLPNAAWITFFFFTALLLGISNFAMILGHYYLVVPKLSEEPLIYCLYIFWAVLFLRIILSLSLLLTAATPYLTEGSIQGDGYMYNWLFISMRYLWGYGAPLVLSFFTFRLCRLRSIQSATGVLYIIEFFVIVGELIGIYLMAKHGLAL